MYIEKDQSWFYYNRQADVDSLIKSLNPKGIKEKSLIDSIKSKAINFLKLKQSSESEEDMEVEESKISSEACSVFEQGDMNDT